MAAPPPGHEALTELETAPAHAAAVFAPFAVDVVVDVVVVVVVVAVAVVVVDVAVVVVAQMHSGTAHY